MGKIKLDNNHKKLGIWMDHASAHLMELNKDSMETSHVGSKFTHAQKVHSLHKSEQLMHNKEQHQQAEYYNMLGETIREYNAVVLFGPTDAKTELFNMLRSDHRFADIKIDVEQADKMTENQEFAFVKAHFSGPNS
jgi:hypothetical protein